MMVKRNVQPAFVVYVTRETGEGRNAKTFWTRVGVAWAHGKGNGYNIQLDALPTDGRLVLLEPRDDADDDDDGGEEKVSTARGGSSRGRR